MLAEFREQLYRRMTRRAAWVDHDGPLPIIAGTVVRLTVEHLPSRDEPKPLGPWWSRIDATDADVDRYWQMRARSGNRPQARSSRTITHFDVGVPLSSACESSGTSGLVSG
ncbi:hypothetical protein GCM10010168_58770 [Actinoplanes ianthinogenes]|uniref:Uncharacterized protein n=1 Tax=Actinoplanes ianthinogenes TaxID=122358 RepID=A0ABN6CL02_9ACTN|nr:hypothetical protein Aiant_63590 [Actinoplanes ianthinogenes]GGR32568.1 hypothetical protein GCM10010168_58770 [Actinoplanes ianthinogenes]